MFPVSAAVTSCHLTNSPTRVNYPLSGLGFRVMDLGWEGVGWRVGGSQSVRHLALSLPLPVPLPLFPSPSLSFSLYRSLPIYLSLSPSSALSPALSLSPTHSLSLSLSPSLCLYRSLSLSRLLILSRSGKRLATCDEHSARLFESPPRSHRVCHTQRVLCTRHASNRLLQVLPETRQIAFFRSLMCTGVRPNPAACGSKSRQFKKTIGSSSEG